MSITEPIDTEVIITTEIADTPVAAPDATEEAGFDPEALEAPPTEAKHTGEPIQPAKGESEFDI